MARKDTVSRSKEYAFPKKRLSAALAGLVFTVIGFIMEKVFKSVLDTALSVVAGVSVFLLLIGLIGFFGAWEKRGDMYEEKLDIMRLQMEKDKEENRVMCQSCSFNHQSLLVGLSATHINKIQEQREFYEDYIMALIYTLDDTIIMKIAAESTVTPIVEALLRSPLYKEEEEPKEIVKWRTFLREIEKRPRH